MPFIEWQDTSALNVEKYSIPTQVIAFRLQFPKVQRLILLKNNQTALHFPERVVYFIGLRLNKVFSSLILLTLHQFQLIFSSPHSKVFYLLQLLHITRKVYKDCVYCVTNIQSVTYV